MHSVQHIKSLWNVLRYVHSFFSKPQSFGQWPLFFVGQRPYGPIKFHSRMNPSNGLDPDCWNLIWIQTVCKGYQQIKKVAANKERVNRRVKQQYFSCSKLGAEINSIPFINEYIFLEN